MQKHTTVYPEKQEEFAAFPRPAIRAHSLKGFPDLPENIGVTPRFLGPACIGVWFEGMWTGGRASMAATSGLKGDMRG